MYGPHHDSIVLPYLYSNNFTHGIYLYVAIVTWCSDNEEDIVIITNGNCHPWQQLNCVYDV